MELLLGKVPDDVVKEMTETWQGAHEKWTHLREGFIANELTPEHMEDLFALQEFLPILEEIFRLLFMQDTVQTLRALAEWEAQRNCSRVVFNFGTTEGAE